GGYPHQGPPLQRCWASTRRYLGLPPPRPTISVAVPLLWVTPGCRPGLAWRPWHAVRVMKMLPADVASHRSHVAMAQGIGETTTTPFQRAEASSIRHKSRDCFCKPDEIAKSGGRRDA